MLKETVSVYERNYKRLFKLFKMEDLKWNKTLVLKSACFMDLNVDVIDSGDGTITIAMDQHDEQNGDLMFDPEIRIKIYPKREMIEALTYRNDYVGVYQEVYTQFDDYGESTHFNPTLKKQLNSFLEKWLIILKKQELKKQTEKSSIQDVEDYLFS